VLTPSRSIDQMQVSEWQESGVRHIEDAVVAEEPLEIRVGGTPLSVTMRTPGHDLELAAGFLFTEGIIQQPGQIASLTGGVPEDRDLAGNVVRVELAGTAFGLKRQQRNFFAASSCGICGKASINAIRVRGIQPPNPDFRLDPEVLCALPDRLRAAQTIFGRTGGLHAAGLFTADGEMVAVREDVGRHNAVDKIVGWALLEGRLPLSEYALMVSGRGGFEIIQKALVARIPLVASVSAPSNLAVKLARELGQTLVGFLRGRRFLVYSGLERLAAAQPAGVR
jgi:FdhD protein